MLASLMEGKGVDARARGGQTRAMEPEPLLPEPQINPERVEALYRRKISEQNLKLGIAVGFVAAVLGAVIWTVVTVVTSYQIGWMAVGIGFLVGYAIRQFGKGITKVFGIAGALLALFGCLLGNLLTACEFVAKATEATFMQVLLALEPAMAMELLKVTFSPMDILFYGIAIYEGYRLSFHQVTEQDMATLQS